MAAPIQEYLIGLGFAVDVLGLKRFEESLGSTARGFMNVTKAAAEMAVGVGIAVDEVASHYENLYYLSQRTGSTVQSLQATAFGFSQVGLKADDAKSMIDALALSLKFNPGTNTILRMLGVGPGDANTEALQALHSLRRMPPVLQKGFGEQLGMSEFQLSMLLAPGALEKIEAAGADLKRRQREAGFDPDKLAANSVKFENAMRLLENELGLIGDQVKGNLVEPLTKLLILLEGYAEYWDRIFTPSSVTLKPGSAGNAISQELFGEGHGGALDSWLKRHGIGGGAAPSSSSPGDTSGRMAFSRGVQNFNPGNIAWGPWAAAHGATGGMGLDSGHLVAVFPDYATGTEAQRQLLLSKYNAGRTNAAALIAAPGGYTPGNMGAATNVAPGGDPYADLNLNDPEAMKRFQRALITQEVGAGGAEYIFGHGGAPLGSENGRGGDNIHIAPSFTTNISGGADPQTTADYVLKGNLGMWQDVFRDAGTTVR